MNWIACLALLSIAAPQSARPADADVAAVAAASQAWDEAYAAGDAGKLAERYEQNAVLAGEFAIERARYEATITPRDGSPISKESGKHIVVYGLQADGSWKVFWEIWNSDG
jgi:ketosteroid isomerase-like protein